MSNASTPFEALQAALARAGSQSALARICGVGQPAVWKWLQTGKRLPPQHVLAVEAETGVSRYDLRPDIYPRSDNIVSNDDYAPIALLPEGVASNDAAVLPAWKRA